jgi:hypothetical protein
MILLELRTGAAGLIRAHCRALGIAVTVVAIEACATMPPITAMARRCAPVPPHSAAVPTGDDVGTLEGRYRVVLVDEFGGEEARDASTELEVTLCRPDSAMLARAIPLGFGRRQRADLRLVGWVGNARLGVGDMVEWESGILFLGSRNVNDGSPDELRIEAIDRGGFRGVWRNPLSGNVVRTDGAGRVLPPPAGHFCAVRIGR